ncbi:hypothetical protein C8Q80DRAFT_204298 [Daedaleopsis nitida]|nr:hypothetical protein C8Q80DRAFT_204298 [Daedaleopsis nitida]
MSQQCHNYFPSTRFHRCPSCIPPSFKCTIIVQANFLMHKNWRRGILELQLMLLRPHALSPLADSQSQRYRSAEACYRCICSGNAVNPNSGRPLTSRIRHRSQHLSPARASVAREGRRGARIAIELREGMRRPCFVPFLDIAPTSTAQDLRQSGQRAARTLTATTRMHSSAPDLAGDPNIRRRSYAVGSDLALAQHDQGLALPTRRAHV